jgi:2-phospho-L-lactate guanylyltransferase
MQATVRFYDEATRCGDVLTDAGVVLTFDAAAFDLSGLRLLRLGQRVRLQTDDAGQVRSLTIATFPDPAPSDGAETTAP